MKRKDLKEQVEYAYVRGTEDWAQKRGYGAVKVTLTKPEVKWDLFGVWEKRAAMGNGSYVAASAGSYHKIGKLLGNGIIQRSSQLQIPDGFTGRECLINVRQIRCAWEEWEDLVEVADKARQKRREEK